ncbi:MAG: T9SS type A sorting domain-containing protein [Bacteroidales bacterium]|nr:T9SS type A sorting domain-containing protein [Bacteroidales bacterium]
MCKRGQLPIVFLLLALFPVVSAQEVVTGLQVNRMVRDYVTNLLKSKGAADTLELPFFDDFSSSSPVPDSEKWEDSYAFINNSYPVNQPTLGVATLDALDSNGAIYEHASKYQFEADRLTSRPLNLEGTAVDNFYLSFFYQPQGIADNPEAADSLALHFYSPINLEWYSVWSVTGSELHNFKPVIIHINDPRYLAKGFRLRFINYASLSSSVNDPAMTGNADHWHIDYVRVDRNRNEADTIMHDVAFTLPLRSALNNYESMPWDQFRDWFLTEQGSSITLNYRNNDNIVRNVTRSFKIDDLYSGATVYSSIQSATNMDPFQDISADIPQIYTFNNSNPDSALFMITGILRSDDFDPRVNDTIKYLQRFSNYFAYDDGTSESGYGIIGEGSRNAMAVCRFRSYNQDTIGAVMISFNESLLGANNRAFDIVILADNNGIPGDIIYSEDEVMVETGNSLNGFATYRLSNPVPVHGYFYAGWRQRSETFLNAGLDLNTPNNGRMFYFLNDNWNTSSVSGILMIRAVMGISQSSSVTDNLHHYPEPLKIWPVPVSQILNLESGALPAAGDEIIITDSSGRVVFRDKWNNRIDVSRLLPGIYMIEVRSGNRPAARAKFLKTG